MNKFYKQTLLWYIDGIVLVWFVAACYVALSWLFPPGFPAGEEQDEVLVSGLESKLLQEKFDQRLNSLNCNFVKPLPTEKKKRLMQWPQLKGSFRLQCMKKVEW